MKPAARRWNFSNENASFLPGYSPILGRVLAARKLDETAARSLLGTVQALHDPFTLLQMDSAVNTIAEVLKNRGKFAIYGDYDADGVTACAMLTRALRRTGAVVLPYIPHRVSEGYGLHAAALVELAEQGVDCLITVDCGTNSYDVVANKPSSLKMVITDHHLPSNVGGQEPRLAPAEALINPHQPDCGYPFKGLSGAGVAWKLLCALEQKQLIPQGISGELISFVALSTVADMMPLVDENRALVNLGLKALTQSGIPGLTALLEVAGVKDSVRASDLAFSIAPRINAAGRMEDAKLALELCLTDDIDIARNLATQLNQQNIARQKALAQTLKEAEQMVLELPDETPAIVLGNPNWPMGIVGLVAGKLTERYARPTFIVSLDPNEAKGSARSPSKFSLLQLLDKAAAVLLKYGGHAAAAGFSLDARKFPEFRELICGATAEQLNGSVFERELKVDALVRLAELTMEECSCLASLEPCGMANPTALLAAFDCEVVATKTFGSAADHLRLTLLQEGTFVEAIAFGKPGLIDHLPKGRRVDICFTVELNQWNGNERLQLRLRDIRPAQGVRKIPAQLDINEKVTIRT